MQRFCRGYYAPQKFNSLASLYLTIPPCAIAETSLCCTTVVMVQEFHWSRGQHGKSRKKENKSHASRVKKFYSSNLAKVLSFSKEVRLIFVNFVSHRLGLYHRNIHGFFTLWRMSPMVFRSELKLRQMLMIVFWLEWDRLTRCLTTALQTGVLSA